VIAYPSRLECFRLRPSAMSGRPFAPPPLRTPINTHRLSTLCFHGLTNCFSRNLLYFQKHLRCPRGVGSSFIYILMSFVRNPLVTPFAATHTKSPSSKSFPCHTYEKIGGGGMVNRATHAVPPYGPPFRHRAAATRYRFGYRSTLLLLRHASLLATIGGTHPIALSGAASLDWPGGNRHGND